MKTILCICILIFAQLFTNAQTDSVLQSINTQVWVKFEEAFKTNNYDLISEIHSERIIRIPADRNLIQNFNEYIPEYKGWFDWNKEGNGNIDVSLRFFERIANDSIASERGIYKSHVNKGFENEGIFYGKFHVLLIKEQGIWKILMDYDSNEGETINEECFNKAFDKTDFKSLNNK